MQHRFNNIIEAIRRVCGTKPDERMKVIACVSGGADSMCMLELLRNSYGTTVVAAHVNFHLRGEESDADQALVEKYCSQYSIPLHVKHFDTLAFSLDRGISVEMAARELRYEWFGQLRTETGSDCIAVAHNANDNAETLLLNLTRGTGLRGVCGMRESLMSCGSEEDGGCGEDGGSVENDGSAMVLQHVIRPMLRFERREIVKYLEKRGIAYATDSTNALNEYKRNRIRNIVTPELARLNPAFIPTMNRNASHFQAAFEALEGMRESIFKRLCTTDLHSYICNTGTGRRSRRIQEYMELILEGVFVQAMDVRALIAEKGWRYWLFEWLRNYGANPSQCNSLVDAVAGGVENGDTAARTMDTPSYTIVLERGFIKVFKKTERDLCSIVCLNRKEDCIEISWGGNESLRIRTVPLCDLVVRKANHGDRIQPFGMKSGSKKISDLLTDLKIESFIRKELPVISYRDETVAIPGVEISEKFRLQESV